MSVDAVFLLAEHSDYPTSEKGQKLYPRYEFFQKIVDIFRQDDAAVAVFKTRTSRIALKRLSVWCWPRRSCSSRFWQAPHCRPPFGCLPLNCVLEDALMIGIGLSDSRPQDLAYSSELEQLMENPSAYFIEYNDGWQTTLLMFNGAVRTVLLQLRFRIYQRYSRPSSCCLRRPT